MLPLKTLFKIVELQNSSQFKKQHSNISIQDMSAIIASIDAFSLVVIAENKESRVGSLICEIKTRNGTKTRIGTYTGSVFVLINSYTNNQIYQHNAEAEAFSKAVTLILNESKTVNNKPAFNNYIDELMQTFNNIDTSEFSDIKQMLKKVFENTPENYDAPKEKTDPLKKSDVKLDETFVAAFEEDPLQEAFKHVVEDVNEDDEEFPVNNTYAQASDALDNNSMSTRTTNVELYNIMQVVDGLIQGKTYYREDWHLEDSILVYVKPEAKVTSMQIADNNFVNATYANPVDFYSYDFMTNELTPYNLTLEDFQSSEWLVFDGEE